MGTVVHHNCYRFAIIVHDLIIDEVCCRDLFFSITIVFQIWKLIMMEMEMAVFHLQNQNKTQMMRMTVCS